MRIKLIGAVLVIAGCGSVGFSLALEYSRTEYQLKQIIRALKYMICELEYSLISLPELCSGAAKEVNGSIKTIFSNLSNELAKQISPDASGCMAAVLQKEQNIPDQVYRIMNVLGNSLGKYDLPGQLEGMNAVCRMCEIELVQLEKNRDQRLRSYKVLGVCAGAALAIVLI